MRTPFIAGNWKMHKSVGEAVALAEELRGALASGKHRYMVAPPFTALPAVVEVLKGSNILVGAQNMAAALDGAHTGEISVLMLKDLGVQTVILGHSERRHEYGEGDELIRKKVDLALSEGVEVVLCVGETLEEREAGSVQTVVEAQLASGLANVSETDLGRVTVAYEPVWAIGTGKTATPEDADEVHAFIRSVVEKRYSPEAAQNLVIQYGGSVKPGNVKELMAKENIDGALVGGASLKGESFVPIAKFDE
ncbi:MAG: triose-phosphate isomerase [Alkalispirochaetaceae bacterium]